MALSLFEISSLVAVVLIGLIVVILYQRLPRSASTVVGARDADALSEIKKLRDEFEARFGAKFSNYKLGPDETFDFFYAVSNSLERFDEEMSRERDIDIDIIREAQGYIAILQLILSWAQANGQDGVKAKAEDFLNAAKKTLEKARAV